MDTKSFTATLASLIEDAKTAVFATVDTDGQPNMRWMTPTLLDDRPGAIYAVTSPDFRKINHLDSNSKAQWMFQSKLLDKVLTVDGVVNIVDNSSMKAEVLEAIGRRLTVFWRINTDATKLVVVETILSHGFYFEPLTEVRESVSFS